MLVLTIKLVAEQYQHNRDFHERDYLTVIESCTFL